MAMSNKDTIISLDKSSEDDNFVWSSPCRCQTLYFMYNQISMFRSLEELTASKLLPCQVDSWSFVRNCFSQLESECSQVNQEVVESDFLKDYTKFWKFCITELESRSHKENGDLYGGKSRHQNYFYNNFNDIDGLFSASFDSSSSVMHDQASSFDPLSSLVDSHSNIELASSISSSSSSSQSVNGTSEAPNNMGKIIGLGIVCFVFGIIFFMVAINLVQYKFRNDLLDDLESSSQNAHAMNRNFSAASLGNNRTVNNSCHSGSNGDLRFGGEVNSHEEHTQTGKKYIEIDPESESQRDLNSSGRNFNLDLIRESDSYCEGFADYERANERFSTHNGDDNASYDDEGHPDDDDEYDDYGDDDYYCRDEAKEQSKDIITNDSGKFSESTLSSNSERIVAASVEVANAPVSVKLAKKQTSVGYDKRKSLKI